MPSAPSADGAASRRSARKVRVVPNYAPVATVDGRPLPTPLDRGPTDPSFWAEYPISDDRNDSKDTGGISTRYGGGAEGALNRRNNFKGRAGDKDVEAGPDGHLDGPQVCLIPPQDHIGAFYPLLRLIRFGTLTPTFRSPHHH